MDLVALSGAIKDIWRDDKRFQQLTAEDREIYGEPQLDFLNPPSSDDPLSERKRCNWIQWRAAPYPAQRHAEYLFRADDLGTEQPRILISATLDVSGGLDSYLANFNKKQRYQITGRKSGNAGFVARTIFPREHAEEIWKVIHSSQERQGRAIANMFEQRPKAFDFPDYVNYSDPNYLDICVGTFSPEGEMVAYILGKRVGDHVQYDEIMGHNDYLSYQVVNHAHFYFLEQVLKQEVIPRCLNYGPWYSGVNAFSREGGLNLWKRKSNFRPVYLISASS